MTQFKQVFATASVMVALALGAWLAADPAQASGRKISTTITADNVSGYPGQTVMIHGVLKGKIGSRYTGLANKTIRLKYRWYYNGTNYTWIDEGCATTDSSGRFSFDVQTPGIAGRRFTYDLLFEGDENSQRAMRYVLVTAKR